MAIPEHIRKQLEQAKVRQQREDLKEGEYVFVLRGLSYERRPKREKLGKVIWIDVRVEESEASREGAPLPTAKGTDLDFTIALEGQYADMGYKDLKSFLVFLTGCDPTEVSDKFDQLVDSVSDEGKHTRPDQPARGMVIHAGTYTRATKTGKNAGKMRTYPSWKGDLCAENTPENIAKRRAELDANEK